jgi:hypothetical protein
MNQTWRTTKECPNKTSHHGLIWARNTRRGIKKVEREIFRGRGRAELTKAEI